MNAFPQAALEYVARGWSVFPLRGIRNGRCTCGRRDCSSPGKHPLTRHGLKDASADTSVIADWWRRWPNANVGIATGQVSGIVAVDLDLPLANGSLDRVIHKLPNTLTGLTGGGGVHLIYRARSGERLRNRASALPGMRDLPGIDLRADGGYVVAPPSMHVSGNRYAWLDATVEIVDGPAWLKDEPRKIHSAPPFPPRFHSGDGTAYGLAALDNALTSLRSAPVGQRNHTLNRVAFSMAGLVAGGHLLESTTQAELTRVALAIGLTQWETGRTIGSAFKARRCSS